MKLREALKATNWEYFKNNQNEIWETDQVLNDPDADQWLDEEVNVLGDAIYSQNDCYKEVEEWRDELSQKIDAILKQ